MITIKVPVDVIESILQDKLVLKQFIILNQLSAFKIFPTKRITTKHKMELVTGLKVSLKSIYNYINFAVVEGIILIMSDHLKLKSNTQFFSELREEYNSRQFITIEFNPIKPKASIFFAATKFYLEKQKHLIMLRLEKKFGGKAAAIDYYNQLVANVATKTYNQGDNLLPPMLTQKALSEMFGYKSETSGFNLKKLFKKEGLIEIKKMKKRRYKKSLSGKVFKSDLMRPPDVAILIQLKKNDCT